MALQSDIQIYIAGNPIQAFQEFTLHQYLGTHHRFELVCRMDVLEKITGGGFAQETKNFLGESFSAQVMSVGAFSGYKELQFKGVVTSVNSLKAFNHKGGDMVVIGGHSGTIIADDGPHYASHNDVSLQEIINHTFAGYDQSKMETVIAPKNNAPLHYSVQNNESSWQYAARLAAQYSEWFYYDGKKLIFGKPEDGEATPLTYGHDLQEFSMELNPQPNNFNYFTNDYLVNDQHQKKTSEIANASGFNGFASERAAKMYAKETNVFINGYNDPQSKSRLDKQVEQQKKAADQRQVILKGSSDNPGVAIGKVIKIIGEDEHYGSYRITQVTHTGNENGRYQNSFQAVSAEMDVYPHTNFHAIPRSETQTAVVMENADPEGMGRIKVQFAWQKRFGGISPWLRIVTPHSGGDKGFHFIPENGEEVLIGFEGGNAERPYVMGSLYHGSHRPASWKTDMNDIKAIRTRSGHTIELNDSNGGESITISDKGGNIIHFNTATKNITISAPETMEFNAKNMKFNVQEDMEIDVGKNKTETIHEHHKISANQSTEEINEKKSVQSKKMEHIANDVLIKTNSGKMLLDSKGKLTLQSGEQVDYGD
ncbi:type VI secretion system Vgr family protein [Aequorivita capsosiphonis]|uniref:type VI secretion system Vgr family protein n=1 Tax=Aequorivita capsosiphonis TaxID=487317 RepID=UPI000414A9A6|nr:phage baseplate assembly protein V [Aequorivita capsosiphonis]